MTVLDEFLETIPPEHHALVRALDALVREAAPDLVASLKWGNLTYHHARNACSLISQRQHVNLQVWGGAGFEDPCGLLTGTGKGMRHISFEIGAEINRSAVAVIIQQAAEARA